VHFLPIAIAAIVLLGNPQPASAMTCFRDLGGCFYRAAVVESFWWRWASGLDCELSFIGCFREAFGF
jgi:hypothetical protein